MRWFRGSKRDEKSAEESQDSSAGFNSETDRSNNSSWARAKLTAAFVAVISSISEDRSRKEVIAWLIQARGILQAGGTKREIASALYETLSGKRIAGLLASTAKKTFESYRGSDLPMSIKAAIPVAVLGTAMFGAQGAGVAAFGSAIGLPVVLILFLGTVGVTAVIEAFVKDKTVRDPLTRLLVAMLALEAKRRASKEILQALREEVSVPRRQDVPKGSADLIATLRAMDPIDFERHIMALFESEGHPVGVTPRSNDFGVDGFVTHPDGLLIVQCKRNSEQNKVGRPVVQQFKGVVEEQRALWGYIVTTSRFTTEAKESANLSDKIILVDCDDLVRWHLDGTLPTHGQHSE